MKTSSETTQLFQISDNGHAAVDIVVSEKSSSAVMHAATELAQFLQQVTGAIFVICHQADNANPHILVGPEVAMTVGEDVDCLGDEGIMICSSKENLVLTGYRDRGTLYAVFAFLEDIVGCRWWTSKESSIPHKPNLAVAPVRIIYQPPFEFRHDLWQDALDADWCVRNKMNGSHTLTDPKYGGRLTHGGEHTFYVLIPPEKYFDAHPEWFSQVNGQRTGENGQLCLTNPELFNEMLKNLKEWIRKNPGQNVFSVSQNDWDGHCECSNCRDIDDAQGSHAGRLLLFVNKLAEEIEKDHPDVLISTLAYTYSRKKPKSLKPRHNVIIQLCSFECNFMKPLTHQSNKSFRDDVVAWARITDRLYVWDYAANFSHYFMPYPNYFVLDKNIRFYRKHGVVGLLEQGSYNCPSTEFAELRAWVIAKLLWNPNLKARVLIKEFCDAYYGKASKQVQAFMKLFHQSVDATGEEMKNFSGPVKQYLSFKVLSKAWKLLGNALGVVASEKGDFSLRIQVLQLTVLYAFLCDWNNLKDQCKGDNGVWPLAESICDEANRFKQVAADNNISRIYEWKEGFHKIDDAVTRAN